MILLNAVNLNKKYRDGRRMVEAVKKASLTLQPGQRICIEGRSGSGKTTLLNMLGLVTPISAGQLTIHGQSVEGMSVSDRRALRNGFFGHVVQDFALLENESAIDNVMLPMIYARNKPKGIRSRALALLERVEMRSFSEQKVRTLSGGERQRVAIARAFANSPRVLLADEPTGALDANTGEEVIQFLLYWCAENEAALILVTHNESYVNMFSERFILERGVLHDAAYI